MKDNRTDNFHSRILQLCLIAVVLFGSSCAAFAQNKWTFEDDGCGAIRWSSKTPYGANTNGAINLQIKEQTLAATPKRISIDAGSNGGIRVKGWERDEIYIKACVQAWGKDENEANARASSVQIASADGVIRASSPNAVDANYSFGVSYDIRVPVNTDLMLKANNGGINLAGISGKIEFDLNNGGVILDKVGGSVRGHTNNGNLTLNLSGDKWEGDGIDAQTMNGSVFINVPEKYSARLETKTKRGNFYVNLPVELKREDKYQLNLDLGTGGAIIRALTANGQVTIKSRNSDGKENKL